MCVSPVPCSCDTNIGRRKHYLKPVVDLVLDWRPLFRELKHFVLPEESGLLQSTWVKRNYRTLTKMCTFAQLYFDPREMPAMLDEILPHFGLSFPEEAFVVVGLLNSMLPTAPPASAEDSLMPQYYLPTLFHLWSLVNRSRVFDQYLIDLLSRIARDSLTANVPFSAHGVYTKEQSALVYTAILRLLEVPVGQASSAYSANVDASAGLGIMLERDHRKHPVAHQVARYMVMSLSPACLKERKGDASIETEPDSILASLEGLVQAIETFFHPSNLGHWSKMLSQLVYYLADFFVMRWNREAKCEMDVPKERRLNDGLKERFVLCLRDVVFMGIFSKSGTVLNFSLSTLQSLAYLEPHLILPVLLQKVYPALQGLVEVHRTTSALRALQTVARTMVRTKGYRCHVTTMLGLVLPGIDPNDLDKTLYALSFMQTVFYNAPLQEIDSNDGEAIGSAVAQGFIASEMDKVEEAGATTVLDYRSQLEYEGFGEEIILKSSTCSLSDFVSSFLGRVFTLLENLPDAARIRSGSPEENVINTLPAAFTPFLTTLSDELQDQALNRIADFISSHVIHQARDAMAFICNAVTKACPDKALKRFLPLLIAAIRVEIDENGAASTRNAGSDVLPRDRALVWNISILGMAVVHTGDAVLAHKDDLMDIAAYMQAKCKGTPAVHVSNFIHHLLLNLTSIYAMGSHPFQRPNFQGKHWIDNWADGQVPAESLKLEWHVPSEAEIDFAVELFSTRAKSAVDSLRALIQGTSSVKRDGSGKAWSDEVSRNLVLIRLLLSGMSNLFDCRLQAPEDTNDSHADPAHVPNGKPPEEHDATDADNEDLASYGENEPRRLFRYPDGYPLKPGDPHYKRVHELRMQLGAVLHDVHDFLVTNQEDDLTCFHPLYTAYKVWITDIGIEKSSRILDRLTKLYTSDIHNYKISGLRKEYPRALLVKRANLYHVQRLRYNAAPRKAGPMETQLLLDLAHSSVSTYTEVRQNAQSAIEAAIKVIIGARPILAPVVVKYFEEGVAATDFAKIKGGVHTTLLGSLAKTIGRDWRYAPRVIKLYLATCDVDKPSIQKLVSKATIQIMEYCRSPERMAILPDGLVQTIAPPQAQSLDVEIREKSSKVKKHRGAVEKRKAQLMQDLLVVTRKAHWKTASRTVAMLVTLGFRFETVASDAIVKLVVNGAIDEHPSLRGLFSSALGALFTLLATRVMSEHEYRNHLLMKYTVFGKIDVTTRRDDPKWTKEHLASFAQPDADYFVDHESPGWLVWDDTMPAQESDRKKPVPYDDLELKVIKNIGEITTREWFAKFFSYLLQEPRDTSADRFRLTGSLILGHAFAHVHEGHTAATFDDIKEEVTKAFDDGSDKHKHRATAEILAGLLISALNKKREVREKVWGFCITFILKVFEDGLTPENSGYWTTMLHMMFQGKDPRRSWPLIEWLAKFRLDMSSNAAFKESSKIVILNQCISDAGWHFQLEEPILNDFLAHLDHPYKGVREAMGHTLATVYRTRYHESYRDIPTMMSDQRATSSIGKRPYEPSPGFAKAINQVLDKLELWRKERTPGQQTPSSYTQGGKTFLLWIDSTLTSFECTQLTPFFPDMTEQLLHMMDVKEDVELQQLAYHVFCQICNVPLRQGEDEKLIATLVRIGTTSPLWHQRLRVLINIQGLYFRQLFLMTRAQQRALLNCVASMLNDSQHEVRQGAMTSLSGMIRCSAVALRDELVAELEQRFTNMLLENPLPRKPRPVGGVAGLRPGSSAGGSPAPSTGASTPTPEHTRLVLTRHAAVLGLGALVQAFPYASPPPAWIPGVLATLARKANNDPGVVGRSVKTILSDFKKTRQDTWHMDLKVNFACSRMSQ